MDLYRPWRVLVLPIIPILGGFALIEYFGDEWYVALTAAYIQTFGLAYGIGLVYQSYLIQGYNNAINTPDPKPAPIVRAEPVMPTVQTYKPVPQFEQVVSLPRFDKERNFAVTLLRMYEYDPAQVDLTEKKWVKTTKKFVRDEFVNMLHKWEGRGVIARKSTAKNAPYVVRQWEAVRLIASGNPLS